VLMLPWPSQSRLTMALPPLLAAGAAQPAAEPVCVLLLLPVTVALSELLCEPLLLLLQLQLQLQLALVLLLLHLVLLLLLQQLL
jgi:hypothetical protein